MSLRRRNSANPGMWEGQKTRLTPGQRPSHPVPTHCDDRVLLSCLLSLSLSLRRLDNLITRFEEPLSTARWDSPLVTLACDEPVLDSVESTSAEQIWANITQAIIKPPNIATVAVSAAVQALCFVETLRSLSSL